MVNSSSADFEHPHENFWAKNFRANSRSTSANERKESIVSSTKKTNRSKRALERSWHIYFLCVVVCSEWSSELRTSSCLWVFLCRHASAVSSRPLCRHQQHCLPLLAFEARRPANSVRANHGIVQDLNADRLESQSSATRTYPSHFHNIPTEGYILANKEDLLLNRRETITDHHSNEDSTGSECRVSVLGSSPVQGWRCSESHRYHHWVLRPWSRITDLSSCPSVEWMNNDEREKHGGRKPSRRRWLVSPDDMLFSLSRFSKDNHLQTSIECRENRSFLSFSLKKRVESNFSVN